MKEQVIQLTTQYKHAFLRVVGFAFGSFLLFAMTLVILTGMFPESWGFALVILLTIPYLIFLSKYIRGIGKYEVTLTLDEVAMRCTPVHDEFNETSYPWEALKEFRLIKRPFYNGFYGAVYITWHSYDSQHFGGQQMDEFYQYLKTHFPEKEWSFLGSPKRPGPR